LQKDGQITRRLQQARHLQGSGSTISIVTEDEFLTKLGRDDHADGVHRLYTLAQLIDLTNVPRNRVRAWLLAGLIQPAKTVNGIDYFDFQQVVSAKTLCELTQGGVSTAKLQRSLEQLKAWFGNVDQPLGQIALLEKNGQVLLRLEERLMAPSGQMYFDFGEEQPRLHVEQTTAEEWFESGCQYEVEGCLPEALHAYQECQLLAGPTADVCFNLANVLCALGQKEAAIERYRQVVELDRDQAEAWNNLGIVSCELGRADDAEWAFRQAIEFDYADAHYNLADLIDSLGRTREAYEHWKAYLRVEPHGPWSAYAKTRLA
jgi:tetratricopeptide (TPR) repeat protein